MKRALKPLLICLLCLMVPVLFIFIGLALVNYGSNNSEGQTFRIEDGQFQYTTNGKEWETVISIAELKGKGIEAIAKDTTNQDTSKTVYIVSYTNGETSVIEIPNGTKGDKGDQGEQGEQGIQGEKGEQGVRGTMWFVGDNITNVPTDSLIGDMFYNSVTGDIYQKTAEGWGEPIANLRGKQESEETEYTITYDYGVAESYFKEESKKHGDDYTETISSTQWLTTLPEIKDECKDGFLGWFISGTDKQIEKYDFVGGDITLVAKFAITESSPSGLYIDGVMTASWAELIDDGTIILSDDDKSITENGVNDDIVGDLVISKDITSIGKKAFFECRKLTSILIPEGVNSILDSAFAGCSSLKNLSISASVAEIGVCILEDCDNLTTINVDLANSKFRSEGNGILEIEGNKVTLIAACKNTTISSNVTKINSYAFRYQENITSLKIPASVTSIGNGAFAGCINLKTITIDSNNPIYYIDSNISNNAIVKNEEDGTKTLVSAYSENIEVTDGINKIQNFALYFCDGLKSVSLPDSITTIGDYAFASCTNLASINIPKNVSKISTTAFGSHNSLHTVYIDSQTVLNQLINETSQGYLLYNATTIFVNENLDKTSATYLGEFVNTRNENGYLKYEMLDPGLYQDGQLVATWDELTAEGGLITIRLGDKIKRCDTSIAGDLIISGDITGIDEYDVTYEYDIFSNCTGLTSVAFEGNSQLERIGAGAFSGCTNLKSIIIPDSVSYIGGQAFSGCTSLTSITIPANVTIIGYDHQSYGLFSGCSSLMSIAVDEENEVYYSEGNAIITKQGKRLVAGCRKTEIPEDITIIGKSAFEGCTGSILTEFTIPEGVTTIESRAFYGCIGLNEITIPASVTKISEDAFLKSFLSSVYFVNPNGWRYVYIDWDDSTEEFIEKVDIISSSIVGNSDEMAGRLGGNYTYYNSFLIRK